MNRGQLLRKVRGNKSGAVLAPPTTITPPSIVSEDPGVYQVGVQLAVVPGAYTGGAVLAAPPYQWKRDGSAIVGANTAFYLPVEADVDANLTVTENVQNAAGLHSATSAAVGPVDPVVDPGAEFDGVDPDTMARRAAIIAEFDNEWPGCGDGPFETDVLVTSSAAAATALATAMRALPLSGKHRIRLDSTQPASAWSAAISLSGASSGSPDFHVWENGAWFGSPADRASAGGGVVIESSDPNNRVLITATWTARGIRGLHLRKLKMSKQADAPTSTSREQCQMFVNTNNSTNREASVIIIEDCDIGTFVNPANVDPLRVGVGITNTGAHEQVHIINCRFNGCQAPARGSGVRLSKCFDNDFQNIIVDGIIWTHTQVLRNANDAWDERVIWWTRKNVARSFIDSPSISAEHTDFGQAGTGLDIGGYSILHEGDASYAERTEVTDAKQIVYSSNLLDGATLTIGGVVYTYRNSPSQPTDIQIGASLSATMTNAETLLEGVGIPNLNRVDRTSTSIQPHFTQGNLPSFSASIGVIGSAIRYAGGTQFLFHDDTPAPYVMDVVSINTMGTANDGINGANWNGTAVMDRCVGARPGHQPANAEVGTDGFDYSHDFEAYFSTNRINSSVNTVHHYRNCVIGRVLDQLGTAANREANGVYNATNGSVTISNCIFVKWRASALAGEKPGALMAGTFEDDAQGRVSYDFLDDGSDTPDEFRDRMYAQFMLADVDDRAAIGPTDPATWV